MRPSWPVLNFHRKAETRYKKKKKNEEIKAGGISPKQSDLDVLYKDVTERDEMAEERSHQGKILEEEQENAKDIRLEAIEKLSQTMKKKKKLSMTRPKRVKEQAARLSLS